MKALTKNLETIAVSPTFMFYSGIASIAGFLCYAYEKYTSSEEAKYSIFVIGFAGAIYTIGFIYSIKVRQHNIALQRVSGIFREINNIYRNSLNEVFSQTKPEGDLEKLLTHQRLVLISICQRIENIYSGLTGRQCMVSVKLVFRNDSRHFAVTYVRSIGHCERDNNTPKEFEVNAGKNTALDYIIEHRSDEQPHYFSADLAKESNYANQRSNHLHFYRSMLVVPIAGPKWHQGEAENEIIGFLGVDTRSTNYLNNGYHLHMLSALAYQIFNYVSLTKGSYVVPMQKAS